MTRWLVIFKSHAEGPADIHFVDVTAESSLAAVLGAKRKQPPLGPWMLGLAVPWPRGARTIDAAALAFAG